MCRLTGCVLQRRCSPTYRVDAYQDFRTQPSICHCTEDQLLIIPAKQATGAAKHSGQSMLLLQT